MNLAMFVAIKEEIAKGVPVVVTSRVPNGRVLPNYGFEGGGKTLVDAGAVMGSDLSPQKARILLMLLLQNATKGQKELQAAFDGPRSHAASVRWSIPKRRASVIRGTACASHFRYDLNFGHSTAPRQMSKRANMRHSIPNASS